MISAILNLNGAYGPYSILCLPYIYIVPRTQPIRLWKTAISWGQFAVTEEGRAKYPTRVKSNVVYLDEYRLRIGFVESRATGH
jgi:hypothetical protein